MFLIEYRFLLSILILCCLHGGCASSFEDQKQMEIIDAFTPLNPDASSRFDLIQ